MSTAKKKVLIITYYWPPAGGPGVQRVLKFAKYLPQFGWEPIILTVKDGEYPAKDESLLDEVVGMEVHKTKSVEPFNLYKKLIGKGKDHKIDTYVLNKQGGGIAKQLMRWVRLNVFIPDARIGWYPYAARKGKQLVDSQNIDVIYSCSPPHSLQLIAKNIAINKKIPWVADFRDPWTDIVFYQGKSRSVYAEKKDLRLQNEVFQIIDKLLVTCKGLKNELDEKYSVLKDKIEVITNGYDNEISDISLLENTVDTINIFYAGNLSDLRIPLALFKAIEQLKKDNLHNKIKFTIAGNVGELVWAKAREFGIEECIDYLGYLKYSELKQHFEHATFSLMMVDDTPDNHLFIAGKIFDYLGKQKPILAFGPKGGEVHEIIKSTQSGYFFDYKEHDLVYQKLKQTLLNNSFPDVFTFNNIDQYSRKNLTKKLSSILDNVAKNTTTV